MQDKNEPKKNSLLKGKENYLAWATRLEMLLVLDEVITRDTRTNKLVLKTPNKEGEATRYLIENCSDAVMHTIDPSATFLENLNKLNKQYGFGNLDPAVILKELREVCFHPSKDPSIAIDQFNRKLVELLCVKDICNAT